MNTTLLTSRIPHVPIPHAWILRICHDLTPAEGAELHELLKLAGIALAEGDLESPLMSLQSVRDTMLDVEQILCPHTNRIPVHDWIRGSGLTRPLFIEECQDCGRKVDDGRAHYTSVPRVQA